MPHARRGGVGECYPSKEQGKRRRNSQLHTSIHNRDEKMTRLKDSRFLVIRAFL
jgi:hypothetical protein